jgi:hypothetical protein
MGCYSIEGRDVSETQLAKSRLDDRDAGLFRSICCSCTVDRLNNLVDMGGDKRI